MRLATPEKKIQNLKFVLYCRLRRLFQCTWLYLGYLKNTFSTPNVRITMAVESKNFVQKYIYYNVL